VLTTRYQITVDLPTVKEWAEVSGLGLFKNGETTVLTDEQVELWFNRPRSAGSDPMVVFQEGVRVEKLPESTSSRASDEVVKKGDA
jgi:hypothetical protein